MPDATEESRRALPGAIWLAPALVGLGVLVRILFLDADPAYPLWAGYVSDEGRWTEQARRIALYGAPHFDSWYSPVHLVLAPAYQAVSWMSFALFGVGFTSARLISVLSGTALLVTAFVFLRPRLSGFGLLIAMVVLAVQPQLVLLSRVAVPEISALLFVFLAFAVIVAAPRTGRAIFAAGLLTATGLAMKATVAFVVPILAVALVLVHERGDGGSRLRLVTAYLAGVLLPALLAAPIVAVGLVRTDIVLSGNVFGEILEFVHLGSAFGAVAAFVFEEASTPINALLLASWAVGGALVFGVRRIPAGPARALFIGSAVWAAGWLLASAVLGYFPPRYRAHALVPLGLHLAAGVSLLEKVGYERVIGSLAELSGVKCVLAAAWLVLPLAVVVGPVLLGLPIGDAAELQLRHVVFAVVPAAVGLAAVALIGWGSPTAVTGWMLSSFVVGALWFLGAALGVMDRSFWGTPGQVDAVRLASVVIGIALPFLLATRFPRPAVAGALSLSVVAVMAGVWLAQSSHRLVVRSYTLAEAAAALERTIDDSAVVGTRELAGLFLGNRIRYTENLDGDLPDVVVSLGTIEEALEEHYRLVDRHRLELAGAEVELGVEAEMGVYLRISEEGTDD